MCGLLVGFLFGSSICSKTFADDGAGRRHYLCASSAMVELISAIVCLHESMVGIGFLLFLWFSAYYCCSVSTAGGLGFPRWLFNSGYLLFGEEPVPISASSRSKVAFTGVSSAGEGLSKVWRAMDLDMASIR